MKKGFTLVELLAVIVILSIIALIVTPIILNVINDAEKSAAIRGAENYIKAVELYVTKTYLDQNKKPIPDVDYMVNSVTVVEDKAFLGFNDLILMNGEIPTGDEDYLKFDEKYIIKEGLLTIDGYEIIIGDGKVISATKGTKIPLEDIDLNITESEMEKNSELQILTTFSPSNASNRRLIYTSSNESVATVSNTGLIKAVGKGNATITVKSKENNNIKKTINITVTAIEIETITITGLKNKIEVGEELQLGATIQPTGAPDSALTWTSSDEDVLIVGKNTGLVTGIGLGSAIVTAQSENGVEDTYEINVVTLYKEELLNGADPVLGGNLVPINIATDGTITKADLTEKWYEYNTSLWANAVVLMGEDTYEAGDTISMENIKQMYVWIPRYKYQLWNVNSENKFPNGKTSESPINIVFENKDTEVSTGTSNDEWLTHPAFTSFNTNGLWIGKFETSYNEETFTDMTKFNTSNPNTAAATSASNIIIKPNVRSLTNKSVSEFYTLGREVNSTLNSHMMKNTEWASVVYLTYSKYGNCTSTSCSEVYPNNVNTGGTGNNGTCTDVMYKDGAKWCYGATVTGFSSSQVTDFITNNYSLTSSYRWDGSSNNAYTTARTKNRSGIYDMHGGNNEYVMSVLVNEDNEPYIGDSSTSNSGFNGLYNNGSGSKTDGISFPTDSRYYDTYIPKPTNASSNYINSKLGDAIKEFGYNNKGLWYYDAINYPSSPWITKGQTYWSSSVSTSGSSITRAGDARVTGITASSSTSGVKIKDYTTRIVLAF